MPFMNRAAFINEAVLDMLGRQIAGQHIEMTNALDVFERSIDKEVRERQKTTSFEALCQELYLDVGTISHPCGARAIVPKYDCINFALYRLDEELGKGMFSKQLDKPFLGRRDLKIYQFNRDIYEEHPAPNLREVFKRENRRRKWIKDTYWVQKITTEDRERLGISDFPDLEEEFNYNASIEENGINTDSAFTEQEIGKATISIDTAKKDEAQNIQQRDVQQIMQEGQINYDEQK